MLLQAEVLFAPGSCECLLLIIWPTPIGNATRIQLPPSAMQEHSFCRRSLRAQFALRGCRMKWVHKNTDRLRLNTTGGFR